MRARVEIPSRATVEVIVARRTMAALYPRNSRILVNDIIDVVAYEAGVRRSDLISADRSADIIQARAAVIWLARRLTFASFPQLGTMLGERNHSTISHAYARSMEIRACCADFERMTDRLFAHFRDLQEE